MASDNQGPTIIAVTAVFWSLAVIALGLRFWALHMRKRKILAHDLWILLGFVRAPRHLRFSLGETGTAVITNDCRMFRYARRLSLSL